MSAAVQRRDLAAPLMSVAAMMCDAWLVVYLLFHSCIHDFYP